MHRFLPLTAVNFPVALAPMVGLSHVGLRHLVRRYMPRGARTFWPTEMLNSRKLPREPVGGTLETLQRFDEDLLVPQLLGNEQRPIAESIARLHDWGAAGIDINMGCPVAKALRHNYGVALMGNSDYAAEVVGMAVSVARGPVSVKLRAGVESNPEYLIQFINKLHCAGAAWVTLHPRLAGQKRRGRADWATITRVRQSLSIPVVGNGDVQTCEDVFAMQAQTGCAQVMVGRALVARPWLMWQVGERLGFPPPIGFVGAAPVTPLEEGREYGRSLQHLLEFLTVAFPEPVAHRRFLFHVRTSQMWLKFGHALWAGLTRQKSTGAMRGELIRFFAGPQEMTAKTQLRD
jgi:tRNA-dihydrouridine synthase B